MAFLLLLWPGVKASAHVCTPAFQLNAFQFDAFQTCATSQTTTSAPVCTPAFQLNAFQFDAFQTCATSQTTTRRAVGWMPEWGFRHDPEDLERRLKAQRESVFNPEWLDRFLVAEEKARKRVGQVKSAVHRAALEEAIEQTAARVAEAIDAGLWAPEQLIIELEAAANAKRATASLKHAQLAIEMAQQILMEDDEVILLLG